MSERNLSSRVPRFLSTSARWTADEDARPPCVRDPRESRNGGRFTCRNMFAAHTHARRLTISNYLFGEAPTRNKRRGCESDDLALNGTSNNAIQYPVEGSVYCWARQMSNEKKSVLCSARDFCRDSIEIRTRHLLAFIAGMRAGESSPIPRALKYRVTFYLH